MTVTNRQSSTANTTPYEESSPSQRPSRSSAVVDCQSALALRVHGEYKEMPGLYLTVRQAARLFGIAPDVALVVLEGLRRASVLTRSDLGKYSLGGGFREK